MNVLELTAFKANDSLGFRAACGLLRLCSQIEDLEHAQMSWQHHALLHVNATLKQVIGCLQEHHEGSLDPIWLTWADRITAGNAASYREQVHQALRARDREWIAWLTAQAIVVKRRRTGEDRLVPSDWCMLPAKSRTAWLAEARKVGGMMTPERWQEAMVGPWRYEKGASAVNWDSSTLPDHARQAKSPSASGAWCTVGPTWLAWQSLPLFPMFDTPQGPQTTGIVNNHFVWQVWREPMGIAAVKYLLADSPDRAHYRAAIVPAPDGNGKQIAYA